jgi:transcriptional regulator with XRE-family HTH domain
MSIDYKQIGSRIAKRRRVLDLTQAELAEKANMSTTYTGNIERGAKCSVATLLKLCSALEVTPDYLLIGTDKNYPDDSFDEIKNLIYRCDKRKQKLIIEYIKWYANQDIES